MINKLFVSLTIAGLVCGYAALLYTLGYILVLIDNSYLLSLAT